MAIVAMPETAMDEDYGPIPGKHKVGLARQALVVEQIAKALCMEASPDNHFRFGIFAADARHHPASDFGRNDISHKRQPDPALRQGGVRGVARVSWRLDFR